MKNLKEKDLEKFIRDNKDKFDIYEPESAHSQHFLNKLIKKFKEVINIVPYLVKVGLTTIIIFLLSFFVWKAFICPPLTRISIKYWKVEHNYIRQIHKISHLPNAFNNNPEDKARFETELQKFDDSYKTLSKKLKKNPSADNIADMLKFYQEELLTLEENIQDNPDKNK